MARGDDKKYADHPKEKEADRYRKAAEDALQQLDWTIGYLHGIRKTDISKALAQNRSYIRPNLMGKAEEPLPAQKTSETRPQPALSEDRCNCRTPDTTGVHRTATAKRPCRRDRRD